MIKLVQWNVDGIKPKSQTGNFQQLNKEIDPSAYICQELKLAHDEKFEIKGFKSYLKTLPVLPNENAKGGVGIFIKNNLSSYQIDLQTDLQAVAVSVKSITRMTICSLYLPPDDVVTSKDLMNLAKQLPKPYLILGDLNGHHPMWYDPRNINDRGNEIVKFIEEAELALLDKNKMTHIWKVNKTKSHVDISICSPELLTILNWDVYEEPLDSDHLPIIIESKTQQHHVTGIARWILDKGNWDLFVRLVSSDHPNYENMSSEEAVTAFENHLLEAARKAIPKTQGGKRKLQPPWWNGECRAAINKRKAAFRKFSKISSAENYDKFSKARAEAKRIIKASKRNAWQSFIESIEFKTSTKELWQKINMLNGKHKSDQVNTLLVNKEKIIISKVPNNYTDTLIDELKNIGCIQTLTIMEDGVYSKVEIRFESDEASKIALNLNGTSIEGNKIRVKALTTNKDQLKNDKAVLDEPQEIANCLGFRYAYISSTASKDPQFKDYKLATERNEIDFNSAGNEAYNSPIQFHELEFALSKVGDSAPGPDEICYKMLKKLDVTSKMNLINVINKVWCDKTIPINWKLAYIIPFLKSGKNPLKAESYRPIALTSCLCKVIERIILNRLVWYISKRPYIDRFQGGFQKGKSPIECIASLTKDAKDAFCRKQYLVCVFFDIEKAYDTCWKHLILKELHNLGLRGNLPLIIKSYLEDRKFKVKVGNTLSETFDQDMGVPQGGVLSCMLFLMVMNSIRNVIGSTEWMGSYSLFVDDLRISYTHTDAQKCISEVQRAIDKLYEWSIRTGLKFSIEKTEWMVFHRKREDLSPLYQLNLGGHSIKRVYKKKFLGLILDPKLQWIEHIEYIRGKCLKDMNILRIISKKNQKIKAKNLLNIYKVIIESKLRYGSPLYGTAPKSYLIRLDPVQNKGLRICLGAFTSSPADSLQVEAYQPSLKTKRELDQLNYYTRLKQLPNNIIPFDVDDKSLEGEYSRPSNRKPKTFGFIARMLIHQYNIPLPQIEELTTDQQGPWVINNLRVCLQLAKYPKATTSVEEYLQYFNEHKHKAHVELYTDGSKSPQGVGAATAILIKGENTKFRQVHLNDMASVHTAELVAITSALKALKYGTTGCDCVIYSDSRSALQALQSLTPCKLVRTIKEQVTELARRDNEITFCWLPGHAGIFGNELADKKAKEAINAKTVDIHIKIPVADIKSALKTIVYEKWNEEWMRQNNSKLKEVQPIIRRNPDFNLSRMDQIKITRLRIGHTRVTHSHFYTGEQPPVCGPCGVPITAKHLLLECRNYDEVREKYFDDNTSMNVIFNNRENVLKLLEFIKELNIYKEI